MKVSNKTSAANSTCVSTGVAGLDELLRGGLAPDRLYLVEGKPGTGKSTLALQFLLDGRAHGESTLYVTLCETIPELHGVAASHGWDLGGIELFQLTPASGLRPEDHYTLYHSVEVELGDTVKAVLDLVERLGCSRVVFDSLSEMRLLARDPMRYRRQVLALKEFFGGRGCTVLLLDDDSSDDNDLQLQSLCHAVIHLEQLAIDRGRAPRQLRIVKFRGVAAVEGFHDFTIERGGLRVFPQIGGQHTDEPHDIEPLKSGIAELDDLLGGGLTRGTTTLVIGPAGAGKSTIAAQFMAAAATSASTAHIFLFDERKPTFLTRCDAMGMRLSEYEAAGRICVDQIEPGELSPGEFSHRVRDAVLSRGVRAITIDSLNGYLLTFRQSDSGLARVHELLSFLNEHQVVTLLVLAQYGIVGSSMATPVDVSYLADSVLLLRFFEATGVVRRAMSVVKKRTGSHELAIREFQIGPDRIRLGDALTEFQGVLTGVPQYTGGTRPLLKNDLRS